MERQQTNDKQEVEPALAQLDQLPESLGKVEKAALDSVFFSEHNTKCFEAKEIEPEGSNAAPLFGLKIV
jgi:hypothetical protein